MPRVLAGLDAIHRVALGINPAPIGNESGEETLPSRRVNIHRNLVTVPRSVDVRKDVEVAVPVDVQRTSAAETAPLGYRQRRWGGWRTLQGTFHRAFCGAFYETF